MGTVTKTFLALLFTTAILVFYILWGRGIFNSGVNQFAGTCRPIGGVVGVEDLTIHPLTGMAYLSVMDRRALAQGKAVQAGIYAYDVTADNPQPRNLTAGLGFPLHPHGISLWRNPEGGPDRLFVINHAGDGSGGQHSVEIFEITGTGLRHAGRVRGDLLISPNDLVATGPRSFIATNDLVSSGFMRMAETYLRLPLASVVAYDGARFKTLLGNHAFPNGINLSHDQRTLYVASAAWGKVDRYRTDPLTGAIEHTGAIDTTYVADNIEIAPDGSVLVAVHPNQLALSNHVADPNVRSPSKILRITESGAVSPLYENTGEEISGASVGAQFGNRLLIGAIFEPKFLDCAIE